ncbi:MAG: ATP-binding cassette domain-containing protein [Gammaproteobacteria bacterium]|nr:ATP-binding cassette domain-containing protein [Gammaproteobacteria bacterium]
MSEVLLSVRNLCVNFEVHQNKKWFWSKPQILQAVNDISFDLLPGETVGIVGESGCGKSTLVRSICGLVPPTSGEVEFIGKSVDYRQQSSLRAVRRQMQMIFQDPIASLNPRMTVKEMLTEPLKLSQTDGDHLSMVKKMLDRVGIVESHLNRYAHEFSGGQCQRIGIARALITRPRLLICDEPVSALDVSIQAQVINLLQELQAEMGLALIFVAHDLGVVGHIADRILVMYLGGMMEYGDADAVIDSPAHPYSEALLSAVPVPDPRSRLTPQLLRGELPSPLDPPEGCLFSTRCPKQQAECLQRRPDIKNISDHQVACQMAQFD